MVGFLFFNNSVDPFQKIKHWNCDS